MPDLNFSSWPPAEKALHDKMIQKRSTGPEKQAFARCLQRPAENHKGYFAMFRPGSEGEADGGWMCLH